MTTTWSLVFDYKELAAEQIDSFVSETEDMMQETSDAYNCKIDEPAYLEVLREYQTSASESKPYKEPELKTTPKETIIQNIKNIITEIKGDTQ